MFTALTIAGSDSCGGAGIQADIKTMTSLGVYAMSCITALTAQNTTGVVDIMEVNKGFLEKQLDCVFTDIYPNAVKIGMLPNAELIRTVSDRLDFYKVKNVVVDPVMISTSGHALIREEAIETLKSTLLSQGVVTTPNIPEAQVLAQMEILNTKDMELAAKRIHDLYGCTVLVKGGHLTKEDASDYLYGDGVDRWYTSKRIDNPNTHGTGCTLSSAIASFLAKGEALEEAVGHGKEYLQGALSAGLNLGKGSGPLDHTWAIKK